MDYSEEEKEAAIEAGICAVEEFAEKLGLNTDTKGLAMTEQEMRKMSVRAVLHSPVRGRFLKMKAEDIENILKLSAGMRY